MAVSFVSAIAQEFEASAGFTTTGALSHSGSDNYIAVGVQYKSANGSPNSLKYGSSGATSFHSTGAVTGATKDQTGGSSGANMSGRGYQLVTGTSGDNKIYIGFTANAWGSLEAASFNGVDQTTPVHSSSGFGAGGSTNRTNFPGTSTVNLSVSSIPSDANEMLVYFGGAWCNSGTTISSITSSTGTLGANSTLNNDVEGAVYYELNDDGATESAAMSFSSPAYWYWFRWYLPAVTAVMVGWSIQDAVANNEVLVESETNSSSQALVPTISTGTTDLAAEANSSSAVQLPFITANEIVHVNKQYHTTVSTTNTTASETSEYTVTWAELVAGGFSSGDNAAIIVSLVGGASGTGNPKATLKAGSTFSGATTLPSCIADSLNSTGSSTAGHQFLFIDDYQLTTNDNIYVGVGVGGGTGYFNNFNILILNRDDLGATNYQYAETTPTGDAPSTPTNGAGVTLGSGDWLVFGMTLWEPANTSSDSLKTEIYDSTTSRGMVSANSESSVVFRQKNQGTMTFLQPSSSTSVNVRYSTGTGTTHDCVGTKILAIRMNPFANYWGMYGTTTYNPGATNTYYEYAGNGSFNLENDSSVFTIGFTTSRSDQARAVRSRTQISDVSWPASNINSFAVHSGGADSSVRTPFIDARYGLLTSGTKDFDFDYSESLLTTSQQIYEETAIILPLFLSIENVVDVPSSESTATAYVPAVEVSGSVDLDEEATSSSQALVPTVAGGSLTNIKIQSVGSNTIRVSAESSLTTGRLLMTVTRKGEPFLTAEQIRYSVDVDGS